MPFLFRRPLLAIFAALACTPLLRAHSVDGVPCGAYHTPEEEAAALAWRIEEVAPATESIPAEWAALRDDVTANSSLTGPLASSTSEVAGALSNRIVYLGAGHGWTYNSAGTGNVWFTQRGVALSMVEDMGNVDQLSFLADYCLNAGATVVPLRPVGFQDNEVVVDNDDASVIYAGAWSNSAQTIFYGTAGDVPYRFASTTTGAATATARFVATIPADGFYPVYVWTRSGSDRIRQQYIVEHSGGEVSRRIDHRLVGNGWIYLGNFHFEAGGTAAVRITNQALSGDSGVVIADAVRFGNGMGNIDRGEGVSGYRRQDEAARYWVQESLGQGQSTSIYDIGGSEDASDSVGAPPRMAANMNVGTAGTREHRVFLSFHSNAGGGRGADGLFCSDSGTQTPNANCTTNQFDYAAIMGRAVNEGLYSVTTAPGNPFGIVWSTRGIPGGTDTSHRFGSGGASINSYGEISNSATSNEFDATIVEVAFHDNSSDAQLMRDPRIRMAIARSSLFGLVEYFASYASGPTTKLPEQPESPYVVSDASGNLTLRWTPPVVGGTWGAGGDAPTGFVIYTSTNGYGFGAAATIANGSTSSYDVTSLVPVGSARYFRVAATNAGGESFPSATVAARRRAGGRSPVLIVAGFDRFERSLNVSESAALGLGSAGAGGGSYDRVRPSRMNTFDYPVLAGRAVDAYGRAFDTCQNEHITSGAVLLGNYNTVIWLLGEESTTDSTLSSAEQTAVSAFLSGGGNLFISGAETAWDLDSQNNGRTFYRNTLRAQYSADSAGTYAAEGVAGSIFDGISFAIDDGTLRYNVNSPDVILTSAGSTAAVAYDAATLFDGFEAIGGWTDPNFSGSTNADAASTFAIAASPVRSGSGSGRLDYVWGAGTFLREFNNTSPTTLLEFPASSDLSIWVYGDNSGAQVRLCVRDISDSELFANPYTTINFTGWQQIVWADIKNNPGTRFAGAGDSLITGTTVRLDSIQVSRNTSGPSGTLYFDDLEYTPVGAAAKVAAVVYDGGASRIVHFAFPFESITDATARNQAMAAILGYFSTPVPVEVSGFNLY